MAALGNRSTVVLAVTVDGAFYATVTVCPDGTFDVPVGSAGPLRERYDAACDIIAGAARLAPHDRAFRGATNAEGIGVEVLRVETVVDPPWRHKDGLIALRA